MKKRLLIITAFILTAAALWAIGSIIVPHNKTNELPRIANADTVYSESIQAIKGAQDLMLHISRTQETIMKSDTFIESAEQMLSYIGLGTDTMCAQLNETLTIDQHTVKITEHYSDGTGYVTVNDGSFYGEIDATTYQQRFAPAILLDSARYHSIIGYDTGTCYQIEFSQPKNAEAWAFESDTAIENAKGTAYISYDGVLLGSTYTLSYQRGQTRIRLSYQVEAEPLTTQITIPDDLSQYQKIEYLDGPRMLERASGYLMQADNVSAKYSDDVYCQAFGDRRNQEIILHTASAEGNWTALVKTKTVLANESKVGAETTAQKTERFANGKYLSYTNNVESSEELDVAETDMRSYCQNILIGTVMLPENITGISVEESGSTLRLTFTTDESFAAQVSANVCQTLYQKPDLLNDISQSHKTNLIQAYLEFDTTTSLPIGSGIHYRGTYTVEKMPYTVSFQAEQIYDIISTTAQDEINKAGA